LLFSRCIRLLLLDLLVFLLLLLLEVAPLFILLGAQLFLLLLVFSILLEFKPVCRALFSSLKTAIVTAVPESQNLHDRLTNLYAVKSGLEVC
jgi:hypothetical protein